MKFYNIYLHSNKSLNIKKKKKKKKRSNVCIIYNNELGGTLGSIREHDLVVYQIHILPV